MDAWQLCGRAHQAGLARLVAGAHRRRLVRLQEPRQQVLAHHKVQREDLYTTRSPSVVCQRSISAVWWGLPVFLRGRSPLLARTLALCAARCNHSNA